jgi:heme O synthase-like polyprenyltransferase
VALAQKLKSSPSEATAKSLFAYSVLYLFLIFAMLLADQKLTWA